MKRLFNLFIFIMSTTVFAQQLAPFSVMKPEKSIIPYGNLMDYSTQSTLKDSDSLPSVALFTMPSRADTGCNKNAVNMGDGFKKSMNYFGITYAKIQCDNAEKVKVTKKLDPEICQGLANCMKSKMDMDAPRFRDLSNLAKEKTATESIALISQATVNQMISDKELKAYALAKYGAEEMPEECSENDSLTVPSKDEEGISCRTRVIDEGYGLAQSICKIPENGCQPDYLEFVKDKKTDEGKTSLLGSFIEFQSSKKSKQYLSHDDALTKYIAELITTKTLTAEQRLDKVFEYMKTHHDSLDPIFKSYSRESMTSSLNKEKDFVKEGFLKYIKSNSHKSSEEVTVALENLRKNESFKRLKVSCRYGMKLSNLCGIARDIVLGAEVVVPRKSFEKLLARKDSMIQDPKMSDEDLVQYVARCNSYVIDSGGVGVSGGTSVIEKLSGGQDFFNPNGTGLYLSKATGLTYDSNLSVQASPPKRMTITLGSDGDVVKVDHLFPSKSEKIGSSKKIEQPADSVLVEKFSNNIPMDTSPRKKMDSLKVSDATISAIGRKENSEFTPTLKPEKKSDENAMASQQQAQTNTNLLVPKISIPANSVRVPESRLETNIDFNPKVEPTLKPKEEKDNFDHLIKKISGLENKLAQAQKKTSESEVKTDPKSQEETDLLNDLKNAKNTLSEMSKAKATSMVALRDTGLSAPSKEKSTKNEVRDNSDSSTESSLALSGPSAQPSRSQAGSAAPTSQSSDSANRSPTAASNFEEGKSAGRGSSSGVGIDNFSSDKGDGITLTRLDGIGGVKANETITNMIIAESGKPFYIEEGGFVKQIIPEMVNGEFLKDEDGKPLYKTIVKGKIGEFKLDKKKATSKNEMKIASPADVLIQDNRLSTPAIRYRELKKAFDLKK